MTAAPAAETSRPVPAARSTGADVLKSLGLWIVLAGIAGSAAWFGLNAAVPAWRSTNAPVLLVVAVVYAAFPASLAIVFGGWKAMAARLRLRWTSWHDIYWGIALWAGATLAATAVYLVWGAATGDVWGPGLAVIRDATDMARFPAAGAFDWAMILVRVFFLAGLTEELLFRGLLFGWLRRHVSVTATILLTTGLFTIEHIYPVIFPLALMYGVALGWLRARTGSVLPGLVTHILTDGTMFLIAAVLVLHHVAG